MIRGLANGTSNSTGLTVSTPVTSETFTLALWTGLPVSTVNSGTIDATPGRCGIGSNSSTITVTRGFNDGAWSSSGNKRFVYLEITYPF
jgi:hypothetical protein